MIKNLKGRVKQKLQRIKTKMMCIENKTGK